MPSDLKQKGDFCKGIGAREVCAANPGIVLDGIESNFEHITFMKGVEMMQADGEIV